MSNYKAAADTARGQGKWQGANWLRQEKRLAILLRDDLACCYCGHSVENGAQLSIDHVIAHSKGGDNKTENLISCCNRCNSSRGDRSIEEFAAGVALYLNHGVTAEEIIAHIQDCTGRALPLKQAKEMIARRGSAAKVLQNL